MKAWWLVCVLCVGCNFTSRPMLPEEYDDASIPDPMDTGRVAASDAPAVFQDVSAPSDRLMPPPGQDAASFDVGSVPADAPSAVDTGTGTPGTCDDRGPDGGTVPRDASRDAEDAGDATRRCDAGDGGSEVDVSGERDATGPDATGSDAIGSDATGSDATGSDTTEADR